MNKSLDIFRGADFEGPGGSAWAGTENYVKEERLVQPTRKIIVKGSIDVVSC